MCLFVPNICLSVRTAGIFLTNCFERFMMLGLSMKVSSMFVDAGWGLKPLWIPVYIPKKKYVRVLSRSLAEHANCKQ